MSATATLVGHARYKDQLKHMRASTATAWMLASLNWIIDAFAARPTPSSLLDEEAAAAHRYYGAFY